MPTSHVLLMGLGNIHTREAETLLEHLESLERATSKDAADSSDPRSHHAGEGMFDDCDLETEALLVELSIADEEPGGLPEFSHPPSDRSPR